MLERPGTVSWFSHRKGFGFITCEDGSDVFCHYSAIESDGYRKLVAGEAVLFETVIGAGGKVQAAHVKRLAVRGGLEESV